MKQVIIIGCGTLGKTIIRGIIEKLGDFYKITAVCDALEEQAREMASFAHADIVTSADEIIARKPDYVIEAASKKVVEDFAPSILQAGIDMIILSVGALADAALLKTIRQAGQTGNAKLYIASGAVGGFDLMRAVRFGGLAYAEIHTSKNPRSLNGAPYLNGAQLPPDEEICVFDGNAREAIQGFPQNVNVSVSTALATLGVDNTHVKISSIPGATCNTHEIHLGGEFGDIDIRVRVHPDKANPKSSTLAAWSILALLERLTQTIVI